MSPPAGAPAPDRETLAVEAPRPERTAGDAAMERLRQIAQVFDLITNGRPDHMSARADLATLQAERERPYCDDFREEPWKGDPRAQLAAATATIARLTAESHVLAREWESRRDVLVHMLEEAKTRAERAESTLTAADQELAERLIATEAREAALREWIDLQHSESHALAAAANCAVCQILAPPPPTPHPNPEDER